MCSTNVQRRRKQTEITDNSEIFECTHIFFLIFKYKNNYSFVPWYYYGSLFIYIFIYPFICCWWFKGYHESIHLTWLMRWRVDHVEPCVLHLRHVRIEIHYWIVIHRLFYRQRSNQLVL